MSTEAIIAAIGLVVVIVGNIVYLAHKFGQIEAYTTERLNALEAKVDAFCNNCEQFRKQARENGAERRGNIAERIGTIEGRVHALETKS